MAQGGDHASCYCWSVGAGVTYSSDYNCLYIQSGLARSPVRYAPGDVNWNWTWAQYKSGTGQDAHSYNADPQLTNVPVSCAKGDATRLYLQSPTRMYFGISGDVGLFAVGDHVEIDWDGVVRTVTATNAGSKYIEFTPGDDKFRTSGYLVANWKAKTNFILDLTPKAGSPIIGHAHDGTNIGSSININNYMAGDFNGDGRRDIPAWPPVVPPTTGPAITEWDVVTTHGAAGAIAAAAAEGYVEPALAGITKVQIVFGGPLDPTTVTNAAVTIVGQTSGSQASRISGVTPASGNTVVVVQLSSALPNADRYTLTLSGAVKYADGSTVSGSLVRHLSALAGDVDGSGVVGAGDILAVRGQVGQAVTAATARYDVNGTGTINGTELLALRLRLGNRLP
jgi:hypothetical protein